MDDLLLLVHRIPYPPNKGDKIRSWHLLQYLASRYRVHLVAFVDDANDWQYESKLASMCASLLLRPLNKRIATLRSLRGLLTGDALTLPYYSDAVMRRWVAARLANPALRHVMVFSSSMAQYVPLPALHGRSSIVDFVDVDSDKWRQYALSKRGPMRWIYQRESKKLLACERRLAASFAVSTFVSRQEAALFQSLAPESAQRVHHFNNGVDLDFFSPAHRFDNPYPQGCRPLVFVGAMDYWANAEAVIWFVRQVLPKLKTTMPEVVYYIVGSNPSPAVQALHDVDNGVVVTGRVEDVRPYLAHATAAVLTLRIARGIQNKVLEAMALGCPVLATPQAIEGIEVEHEREYLLVKDADDVLAAVEQLRDDGMRSALTTSARAHVEANYSWSRNLQAIAQWLQ